ncbi:MAG: hypothetical protein ACRCZF_16380, partial [Gemmataceae bacterium]
WGFLFVAIGEGFASLWRVKPQKTKVVAPAKVTVEAEAEALIQQLLKEAEANLSTTPLPRGTPPIVTGHETPTTR